MPVFQLWVIKIGWWPKLTYSKPYNWPLLPCKPLCLCAFQKHQSDLSVFGRISVLDVNRWLTKISSNHMSTMDLVFNLLQWYYLFEL